MSRRRTVKDVLVAALRKLERYGWTKDESGSRKLGYCMTGAINASVRDSDLRLGAILALDAVVTRRDASLLRNQYALTRVQSFNDKSKRQKQTILAVYRRAIKAMA